MNFQKFSRSLRHALRHLQFAGQGANTRVRLTEAGVLLSDAAEEVDLALMELETANSNDLECADLREATAQIQEAIHLISGVHRRIG
ncbi:hypothetical protein JL100_012930 [Skermanella mucosa]|uniref:hypothetical protein n=1 Tax=Skermanella mucosa TaxID=1789672 RepID=UPI00192CD69B|nr:hypothetical protein [Skermanella mucosa]UEM23596.1 hypothetical protein JL100_012930 [Skermanella mucosa]